MILRRPARESGGTATGGALRGSLMRLDGVGLGLLGVNACAAPPRAAAKGKKKPRRIRA